jgi:antitoxin ParD1/3/4
LHFEIFGLGGHTLGTVQKYKSLHFFHLVSSIIRSHHFAKCLYQFFLILVVIITTIEQGGGLIMPNVEKMSVALTPEMAALVRKAVETGEYASNSEVIREALRDWNRKRLWREKENEEIRRLWKEGLESGSGRFTDVDAIKAEARHRLQETESNQDRS